ncbi:MAG: aminoacyl-tRNA hydrolase [Oscillospiraceae bacterium]|nr:aminoacyl-tRNA hydrolase [Oscillospiraceae bacterium]
MPFFKKPSQPQWIVAGLGNPGRVYELTRHNAGFLCLDLLADERSVKINKLKFHALTGFAELGGQRCLLMKPNTYMNLSGEALREASSFYKIPPERVLAIFDDVSFPPGVLRIRRQGSDGGHKGAKSLIQHLGQSFPRIKLGVGQKPHSDYDIKDWVLSTMNREELLLLREACGSAVKAAELIVQGEIDRAMSRYGK